MTESTKHRPEISDEERIGNFYYKLIISNKLN